MTDVMWVKELLIVAKIEPKYIYVYVIHLPLVYVHNMFLGKCYPGVSPSVWTFFCCTPNPCVSEMECSNAVNPIKDLPPNFTHSTV